jgi:hypothetical protein
MSSINNFSKESYLNHTEKYSEIDTFGRLRVSNPLTLFEYHNIDDVNHDIYFTERINSGASITHSNDSYLELAVTDTVGSRIVCQSKRYIQYQPGKSKIAFLSGVLEASAGGITGIRSRIGMFDDHNDKNSILYDAGGNGLFFELDGKTLYVVERYSSNGTGQTDIRIPQSEWNIDTFGAGTLNPSKRIVSDFAKTSLFAIDLEWLGVGFSRFGLVMDGKIYYCHIFKHKKITKPYIRYASLPIRYELENVSASSAATSRLICGTVLSEGGYNMRAKEFADGTNSSSVIVPNTKYIPVLSLRLKSNYTRSLLYLKKLDFLVTANKPIHYDVRLNPTIIQGVTFNSVSNQSVAEISVTGTTIVGGLVLNSGYIENKGSNSLATSLEDILNNLPISSNITGESEILSVAAISIGDSSSNAYIQMNWLELV